jgi:hypothetical protein
VQSSRECTPSYLSTGISNLLQPAQAEVALGQLSTYLASWEQTVKIHIVEGKQWRVKKGERWGHAVEWHMMEYPMVEEHLMNKQVMEGRTVKYYVVKEDLVEDQEMEEK